MTQDKQRAIADLDSMACTIPARYPPNTCWNIISYLSNLHALHATVPQDMQNRCGDQHVFQYVLKVSLEAIFRSAETETMEYVSTAAALIRAPDT